MIRALANQHKAKETSLVSYKPNKKTKRCLAHLCFLPNSTTPTLIQSTCSFGDATTWHPDQIHLPIFNILHFILNVEGEELPCNLTQIVSDTPGGTSSRETITTFYERAIV
jgi:hypothetical protein